MGDKVKLTKNDVTLLERCIKNPAVFTFAPCGKGGTHAKLLRSNLSVSQRKHLDRLALAGMIARSTSGDPTGCPPETHVTYTTTALGRDEAGIHAPIKPPVNQALPLTDSQLLAQAQG